MDDLIQKRVIAAKIESHIRTAEEPYQLTEREKWINYGLTLALAIIDREPSAQPEDWMERNKERILQAGMEGREIEFRIGGRLFAIREKAQ